MLCVKHTLGLGPVVEAAVLAGKDRVVGVGLDVLLQVLRALEGLATELALVRLEGDMDTDVRSDVVTLDGGCAARVPLAGKAQVVCALAANMAIANVFLQAKQSERGS